MRLLEEIRGDKGHLLSDATYELPVGFVTTPFTLPYSQKWRIFEDF